MDSAIPPELGNLPKLFHLALRANYLSGDIPFNLTKLIALRYLFVDYNMLTASDPAVKAFVDALQPGWDATQTIAPSNLHVVTVTSGSVALAWNPILYYTNGYYEVRVSTQSDGPFDLPGCVTPNKASIGCTVPNLVANTTYYFAIRTYSPKSLYHYQRNDLWCDFSAPVQATTITPTPLDGIGIYARATGNWYLRNSASPGAPEYQSTYGGSWGSPVAGDWNGDGADYIGIFERAIAWWHLRSSASAGAPDYLFFYGGSWGLPLVGDWDGNGTDSSGIFNPADGNWYLHNSNRSGSPDVYFTYGGSWGYPVIGDWNGDGIDTIGIYNPNDGNWYLRNSNSGGSPDIIVGGYGGWWGFPIVGDWDGNGSDTIGLFAYQTGQWLLRNSNSYGLPDIEFVYGGEWGTPIVGNWVGSGTPLSADFTAFNQDWATVNQTLSAIPTDYSLVDLMRFALDPSTPLGTTPSEAATAPAAPTMLPLPPVEPQPVKPPPPSQPQG
ncbi:MAG: fibronectin type III domain-containing protein [Anaerolineae bacterium]|nr:fibronectin type III domain-containing protein [Anaerolineae bacterium]